MKSKYLIAGAILAALLFIFDDCDDEDDDDEDSGNPCEGAVGCETIPE